MNIEDREDYERMTRVRDFHELHAAAFSPTSLASQLFAEVNASVADLTTGAASQVAGLSLSHEATASKAGCYARLHAQMVVLNRTSRAMAVDDPPIADEFRMPAGGGNQALLNAARAFLTNATPRAAEFIKHELPETFLADLAAAIDDLEAAISTKHQKTEAHVSATAAMEDALERGLKALRKLDPIVRNKFHDDPPILAAWLSANHRRRHPRKADPKPPPTPPSK